MHLTNEVFSSKGTSSWIFQSTGALRQVDPFFPYLFVSMMGVFDCLLREAKEHVGCWVLEDKER